MAQLTLASLCVGAAAAQTVQGRVVELGDQEPVAGALIALVDSAGGEVARGATSPSGGFVLAAGKSGRYLRDGAWVPRAWLLRAPQALRSAGSSRLRLKGWVETGGRVTAVRTAEGALDSASTSELLRESR